VLFLYIMGIKEFFGFGERSVQSELIRIEEELKSIKDSKDKAQEVDEVCSTNLTRLFGVLDNFEPRNSEAALRKRKLAFEKLRDQPIRLALRNFGRSTVVKFVTFPAIGYFALNVAFDGIGMGLRTKAGFELSMSSNPIEYLSHNNSNPYKLQVINNEVSKYLDNDSKKVAKKLKIYAEFVSDEPGSRNEEINEEQYPRSALIYLYKIGFFESKEFENYLTINNPNTESSQDQETTRRLFPTINLKFLAQTQRKSQTEGFLSKTEFMIYEALCLELGQGFSDNSNFEMSEEDQNSINIILKSHGLGELKIKQNASVSAIIKQISHDPKLLVLINNGKDYTNSFKHLSEELSNYFRIRNSLHYTTENDEVSPILTEVGIDIKSKRNIAKQLSPEVYNFLIQNFSEEFVDSEIGQISMDMSNPNYVQKEIEKTGSKALLNYAQNQLDILENQLNLTKGSKYALQVVFDRRIAVVVGQEEITQRTLDDFYNRKFIENLRLVEDALMQASSNAKIFRKLSPKNQ
jgi:hypothetical protein